MQGTEKLDGCFTMIKLVKGVMYDGHGAYKGTSRRESGHMASGVNGLKILTWKPNM